MNVEYGSNMDRNRYSLLLITVDCLRADHLGYMGYSKSKTFNINRLANSGISFMNATSVSFSTPPSFIAVFSQTYPSEYNGILNLKSRKSTIKMIKQAGYQTVAVHNNPFISRLYGFDIDFDYFYDDLVTGKLVREKSWILRLRSVLKDRINHPLIKRFLQKMYRKITVKTYRKYNLWADEINTIFLKWLKEKYKGHGFFAWLHYMDLHAPYLPPPEYLPKGLSKAQVIKINQMRDEELITIKDEVIQLYDASLNYLDESLGKFLENLEDLGLLNETYIVITADHGHGFWEHGVLGHLSSCLYEELVHVPLIITGPDIKPQRVRTPFSLYSLFDIIYELLELKPESFIREGRFDEEKYAGNKVLCEGGSLILPKRNLPYASFKLSEVAYKNMYKGCIYKYIYRLNGKHELYNISEDPLEKRNIIDIKEEIANKMRFIIEEHLRRVEKKNLLYNRIRLIRGKLKHRQKIY